MRVAVTGATGFVARAVLRRAADLGHETIAISRSVESVPGATRTVRVPVLDAEGIAGAVRGADLIVHCAARVHVMHDEGAAGLERFRVANVEATRAVFDGARRGGVPRGVFLSTAKVHGEARDEAYRDDDPLHPDGGYAVSKAELEELIAGHDPHAVGALRWTIIRPPLVYGPHVGGNFRRLLQLAGVGARIPLPLGGLSNRRSLVSATNLADAILRVASVPAAIGNRYLISDREDLSTSELLRRLGAALGRPVRLFRVPTAGLTVPLRLVGRGAEAARLLDSFRVDSARLWQHLGGGPVQSVAEGLAEVAGWWQGRAR